MSETELPLRYGCNPHQSPASVRADRLPIEVLNGEPGYVNLLDALSSWQLVRELKDAAGLPAATSFKHLSPAGSAVGTPLPGSLAQSCGVVDLDLSPLACAYARARGADRVSSYGDWAALSDPVDTSTARVLRREFSHGVIAPAYDAEALAILRRKLSGAYKVIRIDPDYRPPATEMREVFGLSFRQPRNDIRIDRELLMSLTSSDRLPATVVQDMLVALVTTKYTQSNSVCIACDGQVIGNGAGQQSRIHCTRIAAEKARLWWLRQHPKVLDLPCRRGLRRPDRDNAAEQYLRQDLTASERRMLARSFVGDVEPLPPTDRAGWLAGLTGATMASDGYLPFRDNVDQAAAAGARYIVQPGGSKADTSVEEACREHDITMICSGLRLFHH